MCGVQRGQGAGSRGSCPIAEHRVRSVRRPLRGPSLSHRLSLLSFIHCTYTVPTYV